MRRHGHQVRAVLTDGGPEWKSAGFLEALAAREIRHVKTPPRSPNHNAVSNASTARSSTSAGAPRSTDERFSTIGQLRAEADAWLIDYNHRRRNHGDFMRGRTPAEVLARAQDPMTTAHKPPLSPRTPDGKA